mmetsp:Transcript_85769/g.275806  ORF Transcript_85769/g.275806 Transcript_85769/m.275806 type:complete len:115 (-) Transcript_85769:44-388(-)
MDASCQWILHLLVRRLDEARASVVAPQVLTSRALCCVSPMQGCMDGGGSDDKEGDFHGVQDLSADPKDLLLVGRLDDARASVVAAFVVVFLCCGVARTANVQRGVVRQVSLGIT